MRGERLENIIPTHLTPTSPPPSPPPSARSRARVARLALHIHHHLGDLGALARLAVVQRVVVVGEQPVGDRGEVRRRRGEVGEELVGALGAEALRQRADGAAQRADAVRPVLGDEAVDARGARDLHPEHRRLRVAHVGPQPGGDAARADVRAFVLDEGGRAVRERRPLQCQHVLVHLLARLRRQPDGAKRRPSVVGIALEVDDLRANLAERVEDVGLARARPPAEHDERVRVRRPHVLQRPLAEGGRTRRRAAGRRAAPARAATRSRPSACRRACSRRGSSPSLTAGGSASSSDGSFRSTSSSPRATATSWPSCLYSVPTSARSASSKSGKLTAPGTWPFSYSHGARTSSTAAALRSSPSRPACRRNGSVSSRCPNFWTLIAWAFARRTPPRRGARRAIWARARRRRASGGAARAPCRGCGEQSTDQETAVRLDLARRDPTVRSFGTVRHQVVKGPLFCHARNLNVNESCRHRPRSESSSSSSSSSSSAASSLEFQIRGQLPEFLRLRSRRCSAGART